MGLSDEELERIITEAAPELMRGVGVIIGRQQYRVRMILSVPEDDIIEDEMDMDVQLRALLRGVVALRDEHDPPGGWQIEKLDVDPWD